MNQVEQDYFKRLKRAVCELTERVRVLKSELVRAENKLAKINSDQDRLRPKPVTTRSLPVQAEFSLGGSLVLISPADQFANELYESSGRDLAPIPRP